LSSLSIIPYRKFGPPTSKFVGVEHAGRGIFFPIWMKLIRIKIKEPLGRDALSDENDRL